MSEPKRCPAVSPGGTDEDGSKLPKRGTQCGNYEGHDGDHTILIPTDAPWFHLPNFKTKRYQQGRDDGN